MQVRLIVDSKLTVGVNVSVSLCVSPVIVWRPVQGVPCLRPMSAWLQPPRDPEWDKRLQITWIHVSQRMNHNDFGDPLSFTATSRLVFFFFSEIYWLLLDELTWNLVQTFVFPSGWIVISLMDFQWLFLKRHYQVKIWIHCSATMRFCVKYLDNHQMDCHKTCSPQDEF